MQSLYILIPLAIVIVSIAVAVFIWAVKNDQFEDLDAEGKRILFDDQPGPQKPSPPGSISNRETKRPHQ